MKMQYKRDLTVLLNQWQSGSEEALNDLMTLVYDELCIIARSQLKKERENHTFRTQVLVNEAYLRLCNQRELSFQNRAHFFGIASRTMRQILVDYAREFHAEKRGGRHERIYVENIDVLSKDKAFNIMRLDKAMEELEEFDKRKCKIVELRYFGGLTIEETAELMSTSASSLKREWTFIKAWLLRRMNAQNV